MPVDRGSAVAIALVTGRASRTFISSTRARDSVNAPSVTAFATNVVEGKGTGPGLSSLRDWWKALESMAFSDHVFE